MKLEKEIGGYFLGLGEVEVAYLRNPLTANAQALKAGTGMQEELIELQHDSFARIVYSERNLSDFWFTMCKSYKKDCETCYFSIVVVSINMVVFVLLGIKSKYRSQLKTPDHDLRCAAANVSPRINELVAKKQAHPSH